MDTYVLNRKEFKSYILLTFQEDPADEKEPQAFPDHYHYHTVLRFDIINRHMMPLSQPQPQVDMLLLSADPRARYGAKYMRRGDNPQKILFWLWCAAARSVAGIKARWVAVERRHAAARRLCYRAYGGGVALPRGDTRGAAARRRWHNIDGGWRRYFTYRQSQRSPTVRQEDTPHPRKCRRLPPSRADDKSSFSTMLFMRRRISYSAPVFLLPKSPWHKCRWAADAIPRAAAPRRRRRRDKKMACSNVQRWRRGGHMR